jgi:hypothetical protein
MFTSKKVSGLLSCVTRKCCAVSGRSGRHWTSMPARPDPAWANQSPGVQLVVRSVATVSDRAQL